MSNTIEGIKDKQNIPQLEYSGYLWYSDEKQPVIIDAKQKFSSEMLQNLPFVVEGMLYADAEKISIRIVNIDGKYFISKMKISQPSAGNIYTFFAKSHFGKGQKIRVYEHYEEKADVLNDGMKVLQPVWTAFLGFEK